MCNKFEIYRNFVKWYVDFSVDVDIDVVFVCVYFGVGNDGFFLLKWIVNIDCILYECLIWYI